MAMGPRRSLGATLQVIVTHGIHIMSIRLTERVYMRIGVDLLHSLTFCVHTFDHSLPYI